MKFTIIHQPYLTAETKQELDAQAESYRKHLRSVVQKGVYTDPESSLNLPTDQELLGHVQNLVAQTVSPRLKYIFVVGIGGSNLGTKAVYDAFFGYTDHLRPAVPQIIFLDTTNPALLEEIQQFTEAIGDPEEVLINVISKSGTTTETIFNANVLCDALNDQFEDISHRIVVTTDQDSKLWQKADEKGMHKLAIPKQVGGRFSVLSAVGLFPLAAAGINIQDLRQGAADIRNKCLNGDSNPALRSAQALYTAYQNGHTIADQFVFNAELESLGKWYRQLMGESLGKEQDRDGHTVHTGFTPTVSVGSTDLHSVGQLYLGGPHDKVTTFISALPSDSVQNYQEGTFDNLVNDIDDTSASEVMNAILNGVKNAYTQQNLPALEIKLESLTPYHLGEYMQFKMIEMMYLGYLLNVNTFNQPNVELYKDETRRILSET